MIFPEGVFVFCHFISLVLILVARLRLSLKATQMSVAYLSFLLSSYLSHRQIYTAFVPSECLSLGNSLPVDPRRGKVVEASYHD